MEVGPKIVDTNIGPEFSFKRRQDFCSYGARRPPFLLILETPWRERECVMTFEQ